MSTEMDQANEREPASDSSGNGSSEEEEEEEDQPRQTRSSASKRAKSKPTPSSTRMVIDLVGEGDKPYLKSRSSFYNRRDVKMRGLSNGLSGVLFQESAKEEVIDFLSSCLLSVRRSRDASQRVYAKHLTGNSGIGKSVTMECLRRYCEANAGGRFHNQFIQLDISAFCDDSHASMITGPAPGFKGFKGECLLKQLQLAEQRVEPGQDNPFIVIVFEEACKGHVAFMNCLNPLLSNGTLRGSDMTHFVLAPGTNLICLFLSNFGQDLPIVSNRARALAQVQTRMFNRGFQDCDIGRMGAAPIFFRPLTETQLYEALEQRSRGYVEMHAFTQRYGLAKHRPEESGCPEASKRNLLTLNIIQNTPSGTGLRGCLKYYQSEMDALFATALGIAEEAEEQEEARKEKVEKEKNQKKAKQTSPKERTGTNVKPIYYTRRVDISTKEKVRALRRDQTDVRLGNKQRRLNKENFNSCVENGLDHADLMVLRFSIGGKIHRAIRILTPMESEQDREEEGEIHRSDGGADESGSDHASMGPAVPSVPEEKYVSLKRKLDALTQEHNRLVSEHNALHDLYYSEKKFRRFEPVEANVGQTQ